MAAVQFRFTERRHGDLAIDGDSELLARRRRTVVDLPWTWLRQEHGPGVIRVTEPGGGAGSTADASVTDLPGAALSVQVADCAPVVVFGRRAVGVVHAGWRGLVAGVVESAVHELRTLDESELHAVVGPCIHVECYEFGADDLEQVAARFGPMVRGRTREGRLGLDLPAAVTAALHGAGVPDVVTDDGCTACTPERWYSHRARGDRGRQAAVAWIEP